MIRNIKNDIILKKNWNPLPDTGDNIFSALVHQFYPERRKFTYHDMSVKFQSFWVDGLDDVEITSYIDPKENLNIPKVLQLHVASLHPTPQNNSFAGIWVDHSSSALGKLLQFILQHAWHDAGWCLIRDVTALNPTTCRISLQKWKHLGLMRQSWS